MTLCERAIKIANLLAPIMRDRLDNILAHLRAVDREATAKERDWTVEFLRSMIADRPPDAQAALSHAICAIEVRRETERRRECSAMTTSTAWNFTDPTE